MKKTLIHLTIWLFVFALLFLYSIASSRDDNGLLERAPPVSPRRYQITLHVNPDESAYNGTVFIYFSLKERIKLLTVNSAVVVNRITLNGRNRTFYSGKHDILIDTNGLPTGEHVMSIDFHGIIKKEQSGFFKDSHGLLLSHFEPISARTAFPCFDEPFLKSEFQLRISVPEHYHVLSNTMASTIVKMDSVALYEFEKTIPLPTYLVAWCIFQHLLAVEGKAEHVLVRIFYDPMDSTREEADYALQTALSCVLFFSQKLFPLPINSSHY
jgi:aminopeptidase N